MSTKTSSAKAKRPAKATASAAAAKPVRAGAKKPVARTATSAKAKPTKPAKPAVVKGSGRRTAKPAVEPTPRAAGVAPKRGSATVDRSSPSELLRAGLNALSPRAESAVADGLSKIADSFGLKKLEDVFDHRVAAALERLGYPSPREMRRLVDQVDELVTLLKAPRKRG